MVYAGRLAPDFSAFQFADTSEEGISRVIAWLIDPGANHAQGDLFLQEFLQWAEVDWPAGTTAKARVRTEAPVGLSKTTRFLDVLATGGGNAIAVENKIGAVDQPRQVIDYLTFLSVNYPNTHCLIYLTPTGCAPSISSISDQHRLQAKQAGTLVEKSYEEMQGFLTQCRMKSRSEKVSTYIEDFISHIGSAILGVTNMEDTAELAQEIVEDRRSLLGALEIYETENLVKSSLIRSFMDDLVNRATAKGWFIESEIDVAKSSYILVTFDSRDRWGFGIAFSRDNCRDLFFGFSRSEDCDRRRKVPDVIEILNSVSKGKAADEWPWWHWPSPNNYYFPYSREWAGSKDFWLEVNSGAFADRVMEFASGMRTHLQRSGKLKSLRQV